MVTIYLNMKLNLLTFSFLILNLTSLIGLTGCEGTQKSEALTVESLPHYISDKDLLSKAYQQVGLADNTSEIIPLPESLPVDQQQSQLGKKLFFDPRLSADNRISCATCHNILYAGADNKPVSIGINGQKGTLNSPPVFNAVFNIAQFWDGRAKDLTEQAEGPILNPVEMGMPNWQAVIQKLSSLPDYQQAFKQVFPEQGITKATITYAIAQFERTLLSPNSPFDRYLKGDKSAISEQAKQGYQLFKSYGCLACHNGINIGGNLFQKAGIFQPLTQQTEQLHKWDGRFNITRNPIDKGYVKVPSLRNIALTAPYFHDGNIPTLTKAVQLMGEYQLGISLKDEEVTQIVAFLKTLTGQYQGRNLNAY